MLWLTWRQHRAELAVALLLLAAVAVPLIVTGLAMHHEYAADGIAACVANPAADRGCAQLVDQFLDRHTEWGNRFVWVAFVPAIAGVFVGAPLLAREFEQGTWRLAVTQTVTRIRWLGAKLAMVGVSVAALAAAGAAVFSWWRGPLDDIGGRLRTAAFIVAAPSLTSVTVFAFATGVLAGALLRRTIPAMAATLVAFVAVRVGTEELGRPHYQTPLTRITDPAPGSGTDSLPSTDWTVDDGWIDSTGHRLTDGEKSALIHQIYSGSAKDAPDQLVNRYMAEHGLRHYTEYQPDGRFWTFQLIESAWFLGLAAILLAATFWIVRRRTT